MKKAFYNIISTFLAVLLLFSTLSFTVEKHYCMGQLADYSLLGDVEGCEMPMPDDSGQKPENSFTKVPCCKDVLEVIEGANAEFKIVKEFSLDKVQFVAVFVASYINLFQGLSENVIPFQNHTPPLLIKDIQVLYETYLI